MARSADEHKAQLIERIASTLEERLDADAGVQAMRFARQYFAWVPPEDLTEVDPEDWYGAVLCHWHLAHQRAAGDSLVHVYNPNVDEHGWRSTHSVVEIVTADMPFLVDSVTMELNRNGLTVHRIIHPVLRVRRDEGGNLLEVLPVDAETVEGAGFESVIHVEIDRQGDATALDDLRSSVLRVLGDVRAAVEDWREMRGRMQQVINDLDPTRLPVPEDQVKEVEAFLTWVVDDHFTFLGCHDYDLVQAGDDLSLQTVPGSGLGILRDSHDAPRRSRSFDELPPALRQIAFNDDLLLLTKANTRATVHRPVHLDYIGIKRYDDNGQVVGERRFLGLYTSMAYSMNPRNIPLLRQKVERVVKRSGLSPRGHAGKALQNILDTFPRDDLFQASEDELTETALGILQLQERQRLRLFVRHDIFGRFVSCFVYVPRERFNTELRLRMQAILTQAFNGESSTFTTQFLESVLARVLFHIRTQPGGVPEYSVDELEGRLRETMLSWEDKLHRELVEQSGEAKGISLFQRYAKAFPAAYREDFNSRVAVRDIDRLERLGPDRRLAMHLYRPLEDASGLLRFKIYGPDEPIPLSDVLPMLEKLGLHVLTARPYVLEGMGDGHPRWILDFDMRQESALDVDVAEVKDIFQDAFARIWTGAMENDGFNRLVLGARLNPRDVIMLRAYCKYLLQVRVTHSQAYMEQTLASHPGITRQLTALFHARFNPAAIDRDEQARAIEQEILDALEHVSNLDEDRILRRFLGIIQATLRTNFFQADGQAREKDYLSFKFDPSKIDEMPLPKPMFEIFVYSPQTEGVHLRGGPVARGGLRWSDRREDFRTEVLGLVKAQMVKNSVIVPVGSKGGFVVKRPLAGLPREQVQDEVVRCYTTFIRGLLDITDNLVDGAVVPPRQVVRFDRDDPYLVVAADKGTATFSDIANRIAIEYGFWLGDAFASGGSAGYDHKGMGITARGGWESVKHHFRELGKDIQNEDFTVVGIGDMGGDVFGNGMLLSRHIRLLAAFNHMHIFLDPGADAASSFVERERLFKLPRSSWDDYDRTLISEGGGIYLRSAKSIPISPQVRAALAIEAEQLTPNELIHRLLQAPVELLWNGGIGTYVKASRETHADVGDRANDNLRVNGQDLRCKVVGEGGNLGLTQLGRIEYALRGGRVYTDAIDNSGGVNCSDHEVNIKILLNQVVSAGDMTEKQRNQLLAEMTEEVGQLVLRQNYLQPQAINVSLSVAPQMLPDHSRVIRELEKRGKLNRALEFLPSDEEIANRESARQGMLAPELAVLLAYSKIELFQELIASDVPEDPFLRKELVAYFPTPLRERYQQQMDNHPLKREIIATYITNSVLNRMGSTFIFRLREETGEAAPEIARAYAAARDVCDARTLWADIERLDNRVPAKLQIEMQLAARRLLERATHWLLRNRRAPLDVETTVNEFQEGIAMLRHALPELLEPSQRNWFDEEQQRLVDAGVPPKLAHWVTCLGVMYSGFDLVEVASQTDLPVEDVAGAYFALAERLQLHWLRQHIAELPVTNHWQDRARAALLSGLYDLGRILTADALRQTGADGDPRQRLEQWLTRNQTGVERTLGMFADLRASGGQPDLAMLSVAMRELNNLVQAGAMG